MQKISSRAHLLELKKSGEYDITDAIQYAKNDIGRMLIRLTIGGLMLVHGLNKLINGTDMVDQVLVNVGLPVFFSFGVIIAEVVAPVMLILGYKVRLAGFLIAFDMFMATLLVHAGDLFKVSEMGGWMIELNALYFFGGIAIMFLGSGHFALTRGKGMLD